MLLALRARPVTLAAMDTTPRSADSDPQETREWLESLDAVLERLGPDRAKFLVERLSRHAAARHVPVIAPVTTPYVNSVPADDEPAYPGDEEMERRIRAIIRWNAVVMVDRANRRHDGLGGHLATFASAASLYDVGFHHFFRGSADGTGADQVFVQGHAAPGIYSRAFLEGRLSAADLDGFRRETRGGLPSYPHPRRMPEFWQYPTVSMGLGPMNAVHQARINRYLHAQGMVDERGSRVWCFAGDGEMDEPESTASLALAAREGLDNLTMVVNCNLQRLDGPVRGNGKIIQELEGVFRGAGWHVVKVVWGRDWDPLLGADAHGLLVDRMEEVRDGDYQRYSVSDGAHIREHFFGTDPRLGALVAHLGDDELTRLSRGGHDVAKVHAAYARAVSNTGAPTAVLVKTVKGWALGDGVEGRNSAHQIKKLDRDAYRGVRDRLGLPVPDSALDGDEPPYFHPGEDSPEVRYLRERRAALGGPLPQRAARRVLLPVPSDGPFEELDRGSGTVAASTTGAMARLTRGLMKDPALGRAVVPIVADEARTFGLDSLFASHGIYAPGGQLYEPVDAKLALNYKEAENGRLLQEGISEASALCDFTALATAHATWGVQPVPMFFYYSMFGFQRVGDLVWNAGDQRSRGFLLGATAGRTTLSGEGLQHCDGHSLLLASAYPSVVSYDCAYGYELAAVVRAGLVAMRDSDVVYYLTLYNEAYPQPPRPEGLDDEAVVAGAHLVSPADGAAQVRLCGSGPLVRTALDAQAALAARGVAAEVWSVTSYSQMRREALACERWNSLHPDQAPTVPYASSALGGLPVVAVSDWVRAVPEQVARFVGPMEVLGTDGWGLSDTREDLRRYFEVDARHVELAALRAVGRPAHELAAAVVDLGIDADAPDPAREDPARP